MSIDPINPPIITGFPWDRPLFPIVQPFTYRDGLTYLKILEGLTAYVNGLVDTINESMGELDEKVASEIAALVESVNGALSGAIGAVNGVLAEMTAQLATQDENVVNQLAAQNAHVNTVLQAALETVNAETESMRDYVNTMTEQNRDDVLAIIAAQNATFNQIIEDLENQSIEFSDPVLAAILTDEDSASSEILADRFEPKSTQYALYGAGSAAMRNIRKAILNLSVESINIAFIGDSIACGAHSVNGNWGKMGFGGRFVDKVNLLHGSNQFRGIGLLPMYDDSGEWSIVGTTGAAQFGIMGSGVTLRNGATATRDLRVSDGAFFNVSFRPLVNACPTILRNGADVTPSMLTSTLRDMQVSATGWQAVNGSLVREAALGDLPGLRVTCTSAGNVNTFTPYSPDALPVTSGEVYMSAEVYTPTVSHTVNVMARFFNSAGAEISLTTVASGTSATTSYVSIGNKIVVPAGAASAQMLVRIDGMAVSEIAYIRSARPIQRSFTGTSQMWIISSSVADGEYKVRAPISGSLSFTASQTSAGQGARQMRLAKSGGTSGVINYDYVTYSDVAPKFNVIMLGANDVKPESGRTVGQYSSSISTFIGNALDDGVHSIVVMPPYRTNMSKESQDDYYQTMIDLLISMDCPVIDLSNYWGIGGIFYNDTVHPNAAGHADIAQILYDAIINRSALNRG